MARVWFLKMQQAIMKLRENVSYAVENKEYTVGVFIDLRRAYDTIDHSLLLKKKWRTMASEEQNIYGYKVILKIIISMYK